MSAGSHLSLAQHTTPHAKMTYFETSYSGTLHDIVP